MANIKTIYLADDDKEDREMLIDVIRSINVEIQIIEAEDGKELLKILQSNLPDERSLIILDVNMPKMNGFETLVNIRALNYLSKCPLVLLSISNSTKSKELSKELGANSYFVKPNSMGKLDELVRQIICVA